MWGCCSCFSKTYEAPEVLELDYRHSSLTEVPPDVFTFERTLEKLDLGSNQISDLPPSLFHCHELKELDLCDNDLMSIPPAIGSLTRLWKLDLSRNAISDVADSIKNCKSLVYLDLSLNHLSKLPEGISQLVNLEELFLNDTYLEFLHANFGRLTKLKVVELRENSLQSLPKSMNRLHNLQRLDIGQNDILELPEVVGTMTNLTELWCDNNSMRSLPKFIGNLTKLNCVDVSQNDIQEIADEISKCTQLNDFSLNSNSLESLPDSFPKLECLSVLRLDSNSIQYLPEDFGNLKSLQELSLVRNIVKALPASIGLLRKLHTLYLDDNLLAELPKEIGSCISLSVLSVCKNRLTEIPSEVGHLSNLKVLSLSGNLIVHLPVSILNIPKLGALWLSESQSKPLLPLNKEIDPSTGQHVLTCYLLPQLPATAEENRQVVEEKDEAIPPRRSRPSIKFVTDMDPPVVDNNVNKRGLLRAPTPYPKELRALAKHASHLRQHKDQNGDVVNTDEPEYEGDYTEDGELVQMDDRDTKNVPDPVRKLSAPETNTNQLNGGFNHNVAPPPILGSSYPPTNSVSHPPVPDIKGKLIHGQNERDRIGLPLPNLSQIGRVSQASYASSYSSTSSPSPIGNAPPIPPHATLPVETILNKIDETNKRGADLAYNLPSNSEAGVRFPGILDSEDKSSNYGNTGSEMARKSPPPYHVAARRAAFFRSSGSGSSSSNISSPDGQSRMSPLVPNKPQIYSDAGVGLPPPTNNVNIPHLSSGSGPNSGPPPLQSHIYNNQKHSIDSRQMNNHLSSSPEHLVDDVDGPESMLNRTYVVETRDEMESEVFSCVEKVIGGPGDVKEVVQEHITSKSVETESVSETSDAGSHSRTEREQSYKESILKETFLKSADPSRVEERLTTNLTTNSVLQTIATPLLVEDNEHRSHPPETEVRTSESFPPPTNFVVSTSNGLSTHSTATPVSSIPTAISTSRSFPSGLPVSPASGLMSYGSSTSRIAAYTKNKPTLTPVGTTSGPTSPTSSSGLTTSSSLNSSESFSKIPKFASQVKFMNSGIAGIGAASPPADEGRVTGIPMFVSSSHPNNQPVKDFGHTVTSSHVNTINKPNEPQFISPTSGSRIPKLPSFSSMPSSAVSPTSNSGLGGARKPEITAPKPSLQLPRAITPTRIPSVSGDAKPKESSIPQRGDGKVKTPPDVNVNKNVNLAYNANNLISNVNSSTIINQNASANNNNNNSGIPGPGTRIPRFGDQSEKQELRRSSSGAGSKIPKFNDSSAPSPSQPQTAVSEVLESLPDTSSSLNIPGGGSKIPTMSMASRKPWIFGTHKNARVVPVEYRKVNTLGFTVIDGATGTASTEGNGIYVDSIEAKDSTVKIGDKILQVDGIDVSNMGIEIVRKILSNCQENIHLLVSRQN